MRTWLKELDALLRGMRTGPEALAEGTAHLRVSPLLCVSTVLGVVYGVCMGLFASMTNDAGGGWQILSSAIKVPVLFYLTLIVTFPSLYVFGALMGMRLSAVDMLRLVVAAVTVNLTIVASFATITAFFTISTDSYLFMKLLNVAFFTVAGVIGLVFLWKLLKTLDAVQAGDDAPVAPLPPDAPHPFVGLGGDRVRRLFKVWLILYALVGAQMAWVLRPFVGSPDLPFQVFRARQSNFFLDVFRALDEFLGLF